MDLITEIMAIFTSDIPDCKVTTFELLNGDSDVTLTVGNRLEILATASFTKEYTIRGKSVSDISADLKLIIRVCGLESIELVDNTETVIIS